MDRHPVAEKKRRVLEAIIRIIDIVAYFIILVGGCYALFWTPDSCLLYTSPSPRDS